MFLEIDTMSNGQVFVHLVEEPPGQIASVKPSANYAIVFNLTRLFAGLNLKRNRDMASIRKREWSSRGQPRSAWVVDYFDQAGNTSRQKAKSVTHVSGTKCHLCLRPKSIATVARALSTGRALPSTCRLCRAS
jgi:hypothetical protein